MTTGWTKRGMYRRRYCTVAAADFKTGILFVSERIGWETVHLSVGNIRGSGRGRVRSLCIRIRIPYSGRYQYHMSKSSFQLLFLVTKGDLTFMKMEVTGSLTWSRLSC
jgi:hypothetical protein